MNYLVDSNAYDHSTINILLAGQPVIGCNAISYNVNREFTQHYGIGKYSYNRGGGKYSFDATISLFMSELEALRQASPNGLLPEIPPFDIVVTFTPRGKQAVVHLLKDCVITNDGVSSGESDTSVVTELTLNVGFIKFAQ